MRALCSHRMVPEGDQGICIPGSTPRRILLEWHRAFTANSAPHDEVFRDCHRRHAITGLESLALDVFLRHQDNVSLPWTPRKVLKP